MRSTDGKRPDNVIDAGTLYDLLLVMEFDPDRAAYIIEITQTIGANTEVWPGHGLVQLRAVPGGYTIEGGP